MAPVPGYVPDRNVRPDQHSYLILCPKCKIVSSTNWLLVIPALAARCLISSIVSGRSVNIAFFLPSGLRPAPGRRLRGLGVVVGFRIRAYFVLTQLLS